MIESLHGLRTDHHTECIQSSIEDLLQENPWKAVADKYYNSDFLYGNNGEQFACTEDLEILEEFNASAKPEHKYKLNVPAYPWLGNPVTAKVIILSLNPGYSERESKIAKLIQHCPEECVKGYCKFHRDMLNLKAKALLPEAEGGDLTYRDLACIHGGCYWEHRVRNAFVNNDTQLSIEDVLPKIAVLQYVGYSSEKYAPFEKGKILPSQEFTRRLITQILSEREEVIFVVARHCDVWKTFLKDIWESYEDRFIWIKNNRGQWLNKKVFDNNNANGSGKTQFERVTYVLRR